MSKFIHNIAVTIAALGMILPLLHIVLSILLNGILSSVLDKPYGKETRMPEVYVCNWQINESKARIKIGYTSLSVRGYRSPLESCDFDSIEVKYISSPWNPLPSVISGRQRVSVECVASSKTYYFDEPESPNYSVMRGQVGGHFTNDFSDLKCL